MAEYLAGLKHRDIAFILGNENQGASIDRLRGFKEAVRDFKLRDNPEWVRQGDFTFESGERCMEEILALRKRPTAVFASNDDMAAGALLVAHRQGYAVPGDISIVGFDDISLAQRAVAAAHDRAPADQAGGGGRDRHAARQPAHGRFHAGEPGDSGRAGGARKRRAAVPKK